MSENLTIDRALELIDLMRDVMHGFVPYENSNRYKLLEKLRALEVNLERDKTSEYSVDK